MGKNFVEEVKKHVVQRLIQKGIPEEFILQKIDKVIENMKNVLDVAQQNNDIEGVSDIIAENIESLYNKGMQAPPSHRTKTSPAPVSSTSSPPSFSYKPSSSVNKVIKESIDKEVKSILENVVAQLPPKAKARIFVMRPTSSSFEYIETIGADIFREPDIDLPSFLKRRFCKYFEDGTNRVKIEFFVGDQIINVSEIDILFKKEDMLQMTQTGISDMGIGSDFILARMKEIEAEKRELEKRLQELQQKLSEKEIEKAREIAELLRKKIEELEAKKLEQLELYKQSGADENAVRTLEQKFREHFEQMHKQFGELVEKLSYAVSKKNESEVSSIIAMVQPLIGSLTKQLNQDRSYDRLFEKIIEFMEKRMENKQPDPFVFLKEVKEILKDKDEDKGKGETVQLVTAMMNMMQSMMNAQIQQLKEIKERDTQKDPLKDMQSMVSIIKEILPSKKEEEGKKDPIEQLTKVMTLIRQFMPEKKEESEIEKLSKLMEILDIKGNKEQLLYQVIEKMQSSHQEMFKRMEDFQRNQFEFLRQMPSPHDIIREVTSIQEAQLSKILEQQQRNMEILMANMREVLERSVNNNIQKQEQKDPLDSFINEIEKIERLKRVLGASGSGGGSSGGGFLSKIFEGIGNVLPQILQVLAQQETPPPTPYPPQYPYAGYPAGYYHVPVVKRRVVKRPVHRHVSSGKIVKSNPQKPAVVRRETSQQQIEQQPNQQAVKPKIVRNPLASKNAVAHKEKNVVSRKKLTVVRRETSQQQIEQQPNQQSNQQQVNQQQINQQTNISKENRKTVALNVFEYVKQLPPDTREAFRGLREDAMKSVALWLDNYPITTDMSGKYICSEYIEDMRKRGFKTIEDNIFGLVAGFDSKEEIIECLKKENSVLTEEQINEFVEEMVNIANERLKVAVESFTTV